MPDIRVPVQKLIKGSITPAYTGALLTTDVYLVRNSGRVMIHIKKDAAADCVVTVTTPVTVDGLAVEELTFTVVATTGDKMAGPFSPNIFNDVASDLRITFSNIAGLSMGAFEI